ncbi:Major Facilitator Superfamily protein [Micrococcales bacterium KH10]|nr:Major Facilitator Superfamily protein [Micrococcales bacterium KH10]
MQSQSAWARVAPTVFMLAWGGNHFTPLLHLYEELGHYSPWQANLLLGMYVFGLVPGLLVAAAISDRYGRRSVVVAGLLTSVIGSVLIACGLEIFTLLCIGRTLAGVGVGVAMSVGTSWIKELSAPAFDPQAPVGAGAKRPSLTLTLGFGLGAGVTGALAQWGPAPTQLPYVIHIGLSLATLPFLLRTPETVTDGMRATGHWWLDLRVAAAGHRQFLRLVVPAAPWVFAAAGVAYAIMPAVTASAMGEWTTAYATALTVITLGSGALVQPFVARLNLRTGGRALPIGLTLMALGMGSAVVAAWLQVPAFVPVVSVILGAAYGITVVAGLTHVQAIATATDLAGLTGVYYSLTYSGFLLPAILAALLPASPYAASLSVVTLVCLMCLVVVTMGMRNLKRT